MKINRISCEQFAGLRDKELRLRDGLNVICGPNESGKSSMVNLLSEVLFRNVKLYKNTSKDKEFIKNYFPVSRENAEVTGDFIDGELKFTSQGKEYTLKKEWGDDHRVSLLTPDGKIKDEDAIKAFLKKSLLYGSGVYRDMLFSNQKNSADTLENLLDAAKNTDAKKEVAEAAARAFSETDGVSADAIADAVEVRINDLKGKHWDLERDLPEKKKDGTRWSRDLGDVHKAYHALKDAEGVLETIETLEKDAETAAAEYNEALRLEKQAKDEYEAFNKFAPLLAVRGERNKRIAELGESYKKLKATLESWPEAEKQLEKAEKLSTELEKRKILDKFEAAKTEKIKLEGVDPELLNAQCPESGVISELKKTQRRIDGLENKLCGMNLNAAVKLFGGYGIEITSLRTGESIDLSEGRAAITEAVKIIIPGVMEMELSPADVNTSEIKAKIAEEKKPIDSIFNKYGVSSIEALEELRGRIDKAVREAEKYSDRLKLVLNGEEYENLKAAAEAIKESVRSEKEIGLETSILCGRDSASDFAVKKRTVIEGYKKEYESVDGLRAKCLDIDTELEALRKEVQSADEIPEEYKNINNPDVYRSSLQSEYEDLQGNSRSSLQKKSEAEKELESYTNSQSSDPKEDVLRARDKFEELKELLDHWLHIQQVLLEKKEKIHANPMEELAQRFTYNLEVISGGKVKTEFEDSEKLSPGIYSDDKLMDYNKLSEGTKESVSLAFRLAVLDQLFPEGGGIIVFDDPFTDMDNGRMKRSAELIKESADRHQIIFLTCREEYAKLLSDSIINI